MNYKYSMLAAAAALSLMACNESSNAASQKVSNDSPDNVKIAYIFGSQLGGQVFGSVPLQVGEGLSEDALVQGFNDAKAMDKDSTAKLKLSEQTLQNVGSSYSQIARSRFESIQPDSATRANLNPQQMQHYIDSAMHALPLAPEAAVTGKAVEISESSSNVEKFSYMFGVNFANQISNFATQLNIELPVANVIEGIRDGHKMASDTTFKGFFPKDSLDAINKRIGEISQAARQKQMEEAKAAEEKLKAEIAPLRGDTLADGQPVKMNPNIKVKGINVKSENLESYIGKPLLVFYFSATCGHCKHAAPQIVEIVKENANLNAVAVASGSGTQKTIRQFMEGTGLEFPVVQDTERMFGELYSDGYVPKVYLVNPDGTYRQYKAFEKEKDELKADIKNLLAGKNVEPKIEVPAPAEPAPAPAAK